MTLGEGPHWDERLQALFFVDINAQEIHKYVPATREHTKTKVGGRVGFIVPVEDTTNQFVVGVERKFLVVCWDGEDGSAVTVVKELGEVDAGTKNRINDGKADPRGRIFAGTMGHEHPVGNYEKEKASLFRVDGGKITKVADRIGISNGTGWALEEKAFYYVDTLERKIRRYDYDVETGEISNLRYIFDFDKHQQDGFPDGFTMDIDGNLWVAMFGGSCILKIDPRTGELLQKVSMPAKHITSAVFGGLNYDVLFITSAKNVKNHQDLCGCTFMITGLGVKGVPSFNYKM